MLCLLSGPGSAGRRLAAIGHGQDCTPTPNGRNWTCIQPRKTADSPAVLVPRGTLWQVGLDFLPDPALEGPPDGRVHGAGAGLPVLPGAQLGPDELGGLALRQPGGAARGAELRGLGGAAVTVMHRRSPSTARRACRS